MPNNTIATNLQRLVDAKSDIADAITAKGGTVNQGDGFEEFPADIASIPSGGVDYTDIVGRGTMDITSISKISQPLKNYYPDHVIGVRSYVLTTNTSNKDFYGRYIWTNGDDVYYSYGSTHYIWDKENSIWAMKIWFDNSLSWYGYNVWTDGENTYLSNGTSHYIFNKSKDMWESITWYGIDSFQGQDIWKHSGNIYCSNGTTTCRLDKTTRTWITATGGGVYGRYIWTLNDEVYISYVNNSTVYNKKLTNSGWVTQNWNGYYPQTGEDVYTYNGNTYYFHGDTPSSGSGASKRGSVYNPNTNNWDDIINASYSASSYYGQDVWTDGDKYYVSSLYKINYTSSVSTYYVQYELTETGVGSKISKTWTIPDTAGLLGDYKPANIWSDGDNIYYSSYTDSTPHNYVLSKDHILLWYEKTWNGFTSVTGEYIWTDGENTYYSNGSSQYVLNKETDTWEKKTWTGLTSFTGNHIWTVDGNIYYSWDSSQYVLDKTTSTWNTKSWTGLTTPNGQYIWTYNNDVYYSYGSSQYVLDKATSTWNASGIPSMTSGSYSIGGNAIWTDGAYICYTYVSGSYSTYYTYSGRLNKETGSWVSYTPFPKVEYTSYKNLSPAIWSDGIYTYFNNSYILPRYVTPYS